MKPVLKAFAVGVLLSLMWEYATDLYRGYRKFYKVD